MQINWHIEFLDVCPEFPYGLLIEIARRVFVADIGISIYIGANEPKFLHRALEFLGSRGWILQWNSRETEETVRIVLYEKIRHVIVHFLGRIDRQLRLRNAFDSRLGQRENRSLDSRCV